LWINDSYGSNITFGSAYDLKFKALERMEGIKNSDFRTYGLLDVGAFIRIYMFSPPMAAFTTMPPSWYANRLILVILPPARRAYGSERRAISL
jgi:hypothetical protein